MTGSLNAAAVAAPQRSLTDYNAFTKRIGDYTRWREELTQIIQDYQGWVETQGLTSGEDDLRIYELLEALKADKLVVAMVAEFSRGKSELINAIFFSEYRQRLVPSDAGRTTMCPTEILWDEQQAPSLKLLPIITRKTPTTIAEYKHMPAHWSVLPLDTTSAQAMATTLQELIRVQSVTVAEAHTLGLHEGPSDKVPADAQVQIPVWRHAIINFPHPLLKQGLVILDTPGLNSLGTEPELTLSLLPKAHAMLFVLAADAGVTKSDLQVWTEHVRVATGGSPMGRFAVLNKIDTLWDELRDESHVKATLARQVEETARALGVPKSQVFPVSAQKGLVAKVRGDHALLARSGLPGLERRLSTELIAAKQQILRGKITRDMGTIIETTKAMVEGRKQAVGNQMAELRALSGKSQ
ncbi:MAG: dynamin family protein, partial [Pseudomonadota bacterium]